MAKEDQSKELFKDEVDRTNKEIDEIKEVKTSKAGRNWEISFSP